MDLNNKRKIAMSFAEAMDYFRIVPRIILVCYSIMMYEVVQWYMELTNPTTEQASLIVTLLGIAGAIIGLYQKGGKAWSKDDFND